MEAEQYTFMLEVDSMSFVDLFPIVFVIGVLGMIGGYTLFQFVKSNLRDD